MDNVGDWLYIVFLIIAAVSGLFSSKDKKKKKSRPDILGQPDREIVPNDQPTEGHSSCHPICFKYKSSTLLQTLETK